MRRTISILTLMILVVTATSLWAHEEYRFIGTLMNVAKSQIEVKVTKGGKVYKIAVDHVTIVRRDKEKVTLAELKKGQSVVVDAVGDSIQDTVAEEIRIVPAIAKPGK